MSEEEVILWRCGVEIITKRLILRPIITDDVYDVFEYSKEPNVGPNAGWKPHVQTFGLGISWVWRLIFFVIIIGLIFFVLPMLAVVFFIGAVCYYLYSWLFG